MGRCQVADASRGRLCRERLAPIPNSPGEMPNTVIRSLKIRRIQPQMDRINADKEAKNAVFICVFYLRPSEFICG